MFITKRAFNEAIQKAVREAEDKMWRIHEEETKNRYEYERLEKINERLLKVEEACGLIKTEKVCPCGVVYPKI